MAASIIRLSGSVIAALDHSDETVMLALRPANVIKSEGVPGVDASTRWSQGGILHFSGASVEGRVGAVPAPIADGRISLNRVGYVDMIPIPLHAAGFVRLDLTLSSGRDAALSVSASEVVLELSGHAQYLEHLPAG